MRMLCERYCEVSKDIYACFIDYEKAFDRVNHESMIKCLKDIGLNGKDIRLIVNLYWTQKAYIQLEQDLSGEIIYPHHSLQNEQHTILGKMASPSTSAGYTHVFGLVIFIWGADM